MQNKKSIKDYHVLTQKGSRTNHNKNKTDCSLQQQKPLMGPSTNVVTSNKHKVSQITPHIKPPLDMKALEEKLMLWPTLNCGRSKLHKKETFDLRDYRKQHQPGPPSPMQNEGPRISPRFIINQRVDSRRTHHLPLGPAYQDPGLANTQHT